MPKKNFYLPEEDINLYEKAKEYAGESVSSVIVDALKEFVKKKEAEARGMKEYPLFIGRENVHFQDAQYEGIKFTGMIVAEIVYEQYQDTQKTAFTVFTTKKGKFLVYILAIYEDGEIVKKHYIYSNMSEFMSSGYPSDLISLAIKNMPQVQFRELDV